MSQQKHKNLSTFELVLISAAVGLALLIVGSLTALITELPPYIIIIVFTVVYCAMQTAVCIFAHRATLDRQSHDTVISLERHICTAVRRLEFPVVITNAEGTISWANSAMLNLCEADAQSALMGKNLAVYTGVPMADVISATSLKGITLAVGGKNFDISTYLLEAPDRDYWLTFFAERSELDSALAKLDRETAVVAYIALDNLEELAQYVRVSYREAANSIEGILREWALGMGGMIREYDRDKYLAIFPRQKLSECTDNHFEILDRIREVDLGDGSMSVTVSMGVCAVGETFEERDRDASTALETAIQRGGDQVALRTADGIEYFGGKTKIRQRRTKVRSRVIADRLIQYIAEAGNVIIMGHKNPDFDSIGSCVGVARLAMGYNPNVKIVIDRSGSNFRLSTEKLLREVPEYDNIFIDSAAGLDLVRSDTLLIITDVNNYKIVESPEIAANVYNTVIIDHHRKIADFETEPVIAYIEPSASSASELVSEILEIASMGTAVPEGAKITRQEANIMLAGIMLDTKNFTRTTSGRTFYSAQYLREAGADPEYARTFFFADLESFVTESKLGAEVRLYRERIAISVCDGAGSQDDRIAASKTADTLLSVRQVDAAFVLLRTSDSIIISARSNGTVNVQLILEKLGGGGHFDAAGAQVKNPSTREVLEQLKAAIDEFLGE